MQMGQQSPGWHSFNATGRAHTGRRGASTLYSSTVCANCASERPWYFREQGSFVHSQKVQARGKLNSEPAFL